MSPAAPDPVPVAVLASGGGSNFQALMDHARAEAIARPARSERDGPEPGGVSEGRSERAKRGVRPGRSERVGEVAPTAGWRPVLLVSDREGAGVLERARAAGVEAAVVPVRGRSPAAVARETLALLEDRKVGALLLAGYLRLVPAEVVRRYHGRILNVHPALLPSFGGPGMYGMNVHRAVIEAGVRVTGATVHLVDEEYDRGRIVAQWPVPVLEGDAPEDVAERVLAVEHRLYPRAVDRASAAWAAGREPEPLVEPGDAFRLVAARASGRGAATSGPDHPTDIEREAS